MNKFLVWLAEMIVTAFTAAKAATPIPIVSKPTTPSANGATASSLLLAQLVAIVTHESGAEGPDPETGGQTFALTAGQALRIAQLIIQYANPVKGLTIPLFAAWIWQESRFSPAAVNPNNNIGHTGDSPYMIFLRSDIGIAQIDGKEMGGWPTMANLSWQEQQTKAYDIEYAIPAMAAMCVSLLDRAQVAAAQWNAGNSDPAPPPWGADYRILGITAYNSGFGGATKTGASYAYGVKIMGQAVVFAKALGLTA